MFDVAKLQQVALAALCAAVLTTVSVGAAVGPARQLETANVYAAASAPAANLA